MIDTPLKTLDCICTRGETFVGRVIRHFTKDRAENNGVPIANHCGLIIYIERNPMVIEMLSTGLELNPLNSYLRGRNKIVTIKRLPFTDPEIVDAKKFLLSAYWTDAIKYSYKELLKFPTFCKWVGLDKVVSPKLYCSEFCEIIAQKYNKSWVVSPDGSNPAIAPINIQFGRGTTVWEEHA